MATLTNEAPNVVPVAPLPKVPSGIDGLDEITSGGLPKGRTVLVCGGPGSGKTLLGLEFLVRGATQHDEPGVFMAFEETAPELAANVASLGFDLNDLVARGKLSLDHVRVERREIEETGEYDLEGLFIRLGFAIDNIGAKRVVLDTIEALFAGFSNEAILRAELRRLFRWMKDKGVTAIVTGERGQDTLTRYGLEEYVSDCVIVLDNRVNDQVSTRRLRVMKYRGSTHGTNEYPFLIDEGGISILPITAMTLAHGVSAERVSTGVDRLDAMLGGEGVYRGSSVLVSGTAGTGKTTFAASAADASCRRGERVLYLPFEESPAQIVRNMRSIGLDLQPWVDNGLLCFDAARPQLYGLEMHLATIHRKVDQIDPRLVVVDPVTNLSTVGTLTESRSMLTRLIDFLKSREITAVFTSLTGGGGALEQTEVGVSSLMDTWLMLATIESSGERNRGLQIVKSRGMAHSNQIREFLLTNEGVELRDVYVGPAGVLTGAARAAQEAQERAEAGTREQEIGRRKRELERKRQAVEAQMAALRSQFETEEEELARLISQEEQRVEMLVGERREMARLRRADSSK